LGRVIHTTNPTRQRAAIIKKIITTVREHSKSAKTEKDLPELAVFLISNLKEIRDSVDRTAEAWEKRDYWLKADAFRRQWSWVDKSLAGLEASLKTGDPSAIRQKVIDLVQSMNAL
jgi:hypothetical protein